MHRTYCTWGNLMKNRNRRFFIQELPHLIVLLSIGIYILITNNTVLISLSESPPSNMTGTSFNSYFKGVAYTGAYLRVGINDYGAFGIMDEDLGIVGFQYPIGYIYESLATGWWGDGWSIFYGEKSGGFSPHDDAWGVIEGVTPTISSTATAFSYVHTVSLKTNDNTLLLTFRFEFFKDKKYIKVETHIKNIGNEVITDLEYKRIVDWDVWLGFYNYWGVDDIRRPNLNLAVAFINGSIIGEAKAVYMGLASLEPPTDYDLDWDDYRSRGIYFPIKVSIRPDGTVPYGWDGCVVYDWFLGELRPGETKTIHLVYAAGDSLEELELNVEEALQQYRIPVGGYIASPDAKCIPLAMCLTLVIGIMVTVVLRIRSVNKTA